MISTFTIALQESHILAFRPLGLAFAPLENFLGVATSLGLRVEVCERAHIDTLALEALVEKIGPPKFGTESKSLLLSGGYYEEQVSLAAQYLLFIGYRTLILRDLIVARDPAHTHYHDLRLSQGGAELTTLKQVVYEWLATENDDRVRAVLTGL